MPVKSFQPHDTLYLEGETVEAPWTQISTETVSSSTAKRNPYRIKIHKKMMKISAMVKLKNRKKKYRKNIRFLKKNKRNKKMSPMYLSQQILLFSNYNKSKIVNNLKKVYLIIHKSTKKTRNLNKRFYFLTFLSNRTKLEICLVKTNLQRKNRKKLNLSTFLLIIQRTLIILPILQFYPSCSWRKEGGKLNYWKQTRKSINTANNLTIWSSTISQKYFQ